MRLLSSFFDNGKSRSKNGSSFLSATSQRRVNSAALVTGIMAMVAASAGSMLVAAPAATAVSDSIVFISTADTTWKYSDNGTDPAAGSADRLSWTATDFDDSGWKEGKGSFGAKKGQPTGIDGGYVANTLLSQYLPGQDEIEAKDRIDVPTFHFRSSFDVTEEQLANIQVLQTQVVYDDGAQIFINGTKVAGLSDERVEAASEEKRNSMYAGSGNSEPTVETVSIDKNVLHAGENDIAIALYQDREKSSDIYLDMVSLTGETQIEALPSNEVLTVGSNESERNVTWYNQFPVEQNLRVFTGDTNAAAAATSGITTIPAGNGSITSSGEFRYTGLIDGLQPSTTYSYQVGSETDGWSEWTQFTTGDANSDFDFLFFGDPQIGASGNVESDEAGWTDTLDVAFDTYPDSELLFSAGDQVEHAANETEYDAFLSPSQLKEYATVPTNGNHDVGSKAYENHFEVPNWDPTAGAASNGTSSGGDYWFIYKDVLFLNINSNSSDFDSHEAFLRETIAEQGDNAKWTVLAFHHSIYSVAKHVNDTKIVEMREKLPTLISELNVDLVLMGHDHSYTRSYLIKDGELADPSETAAQGEVTASDGEVLYVTANSASGSKYYNFVSPDAWYASVANQEKVRNYSHLEVTDNSITISTIRSQANGEEKPVNSVVDSVTLNKENTDPEPTEMETVRVGGADRYETSASVLQQFSANKGEKLFVASGTDYADALSIATVAAKENGSLVVTAPDKLRKATADAIRAVEPSKIVIVGGKDAVSDTVANELADLVGGKEKVSRISGTDRYETSQKIYDTFYADVNDGSVFVATGTNYADALAAAPVAAKENAPILLLRSKYAGNASAQFKALVESLKNQKVAALTVVGGTQVISESLVNDLQKATGLEAKRVAGTDRYQTAMKLNEAFGGGEVLSLEKAADSGVQQAWLASGTDFADALAVSAVAARSGSPIYLARPNCVSESVRNAVLGLPLSKLNVAGGTGALSESVKSLSTICK